MAADRVAAQEDYMLSCVQKRGALRTIFKHRRPRERFSSVQREKRETAHELSLRNYGSHCKEHHLIDIMKKLTLREPIFVTTDTYKENLCRTLRWESTFSFRIFVHTSVFLSRP